MQYVLARLEQEARDFAYKVYITDSIYYYMDGQRVTIRWEDSLKKKPDHRTAQEIVGDTLLGAGLILKE